MQRVAEFAHLWIIEGTVASLPEMTIAHFPIDAFTAIDRTHFIVWVEIRLILSEHPLLSLVVMLGVIFTRLELGKWWSCYLIVSVGCCDNTFDNLVY